MQVYAWIAKPEVEWLNLPRSSMYQVRNQNSGCSAAPVESTLCLWGCVWWSGVKMVLALVLLGCGSIWWGFGAKLVENLSCTCLMGCRSCGVTVWDEAILYQQLSVCVAGVEPLEGAKSGSASTGRVFVFPCFPVNLYFHVSSTLWKVWGRING